MLTSISIFVIFKCTKKKLWCIQGGNVAIKNGKIIKEIIQISSFLTGKKDVGKIVIVEILLNYLSLKAE